MLFELIKGLIKDLDGTSLDEVDIVFGIVNFLRVLTNSMTFFFLLDPFLFNKIFSDSFPFIHFRFSSAILLIA